MNDQPAPDRRVSGAPHRQTWSYFDDPQHGVECGVWACETGMWRIRFAPNKLEFFSVIEGHVRFPRRVNAGFLQVVSPSAVRLRVYERGAGETLACGTGACAAVVAGIQQGLLQRRVAGIGPVVDPEPQPLRYQQGKLVQGTGEIAPAIGIDIGRPGRRRHADHQFVVGREPMLLGRCEDASVHVRRMRRRHQATAGQPAEQDEVATAAEHNQLPDRLGGS